MIYVFEITTLKNTLATAKQKTVLKVAQGITYRVEWVFPPGPSGLLHCQISDGLHQVWPTNPDGNIAGDGETISFDDQLAILQPPYELDCFTWNEDDTYPHTMWIRIGINAISGVPTLSAAELASATQSPL